MAITSGSTVKADITATPNVANYNGVDLKEKKTLLSNTIPQCAVVDYKNKYIYVLQCRQGGKNPDYGASQGDIDINKMDFSGNRVSTIRLVHGGTWDNTSTPYYNTEFNEYNYAKGGVTGFGHGTQMAIEYAPDGVYLWIDYESPSADRAKDLTEGITDCYVVGKKLVRVPATDNATFTYGDSRLKTFTLTSRIAGLVDSNFATVSIDNVNKLLAVKYVNDKNKMKVTTFSYYYNANYATSKAMSDIVFTELETFDAPLIRWPKAADNGWGTKVFANLIPNGWVIFGDYCYFYGGTAYWGESLDDGQLDWYSPKPELVTAGCYRFNEDGSYGVETRAGNHHVVCYNRKTKVKEVFHTEMYKSISPFRESEGMHIVPTLDSSGNVTALELIFGVANGVPGDRSWTLLSKKTTL